uniref:Ig-like domain-containing protein n=1 Tax=Cyprinus carpio TaxID=7962 RepID=A0A8C2D9T4_CYPCA
LLYSTLYEHSPQPTCLQVNQNPLMLILQQGEPLKVVCSITGTNNPDLYWYRWTPTDGFKLMFSSFTAGSVDPASVGDFSSNRPGLLQIVLESNSVTDVGSVVWFCAASPHSMTDYNESCTKTLRDENCFSSSFEGYCLI